MNESNEMFASFAIPFATKPPEGFDDRLVSPTYLQRRSLDYSLTSLRAVDDYLDHIRPPVLPDLVEQPWFLTVVDCGAYVGEVIVRASPKPLRWFKFDEIVNLRLDAKNWLGDQLEMDNQAVIATSDYKFMTAPHSKVCKSIRGEKDAGVWHYAVIALDLIAKADARTGIVTL